MTRNKIRRICGGFCGIKGIVSAADMVSDPERKR